MSGLLSRSALIIKRVWTQPRVTGDNGQQLHLTWGKVLMAGKIRQFHSCLCKLCAKLRSKNLLSSLQAYGQWTCTAVGVVGWLSSGFAQGKPTWGNAQTFMAST
mmetsp:Transcript_21944/g.39478  ORF Transcript_21944/g.39478 Transcript_21944/m.39478 type:complete len:104 (+) Transcript_21944:501-812(+)